MKYFRNEVLDDDLVKFIQVHSKHVFNLQRKEAVSQFLDFLIY